MQSHNNKKGKFLYSEVASTQDCSKCFILYFTADLFNQTLSQVVWDASSHVLQLMCDGCLYISTNVYSQVFIYTAECTGTM